MGEQQRRLGSLVRHARTRRELTQEDLARRVGMGTSTLRALESGRADGPNFYSVLDLMSALGIEPEELRSVMRIEDAG